MSIKEKFLWIFGINGVKDSYSYHSGCLIILGERRMGLIGVLFKKIYSFFRANTDVLIFGAIMAFIIILPQFMFPLIAGDFYKGINYGNYGEDDIGYYQKGKEVLEGHGVGSPALKIGKDNPDPHGVYIDYFLFGSLRIFGLGEVSNIVVIYTFITALGVIILIWLITFLMQQLTGNRALSITAACFVVGGYNLLLSSPVRSSPFSSFFNLYGRPVMPLLASIIFFLFLIFLHRAIVNERRIDVLLAGSILGLLFYVYFFAWTFAFAILGILFIWYLLSHDWHRLKIVAIVGFMGIIIGSFSLWRMMQFLSTETGRRASFLQTSAGRSLAVVSKLSILSIFGLIAVVWLYKRKRFVIPVEVPFMFALSLAGFIAMNQQLITNKSVQSMHYFFYFIVPMAIIVGFYSFFQIFKVFNRLRFLRIVTSIILVVVIFSAFKEQVRATYDTITIKMYAQQYGPIMEVLRNDKIPSVALLSDLFLGHAVTIYTNHDLFIGSNAGTYFMPTSHIKNAIFVYAYLNTEARGNLKQFLYKNDRSKESRLPYEYIPELQGDEAKIIFGQIEAYLSNYKDGKYYGYLLDIKDPQAQQRHEEIMDELAMEYNKLTENGPDQIVSILKENDVKYILWDKLQSPNWDLSFLPKKEEVARSGSLILYRINY